MKNSIMAKPITKDRFSGFSAFPILAVMIALLVGAVIGTFDPSIWEAVVGAIIMAVIIIFRQDELAATAVIIISLYYDWYLKQGWVLAQIMALVLLLIFFLARSSRYPWAGPHALWLWSLMLILALFPI